METESELREKWLKKCEKIIQKNEYFERKGIIDQSWTSFEVCAMYDAYSEVLVRGVYKNSKDQNNPEFEAYLLTIRKILKISCRDDEKGFRTFIIANLVDYDDQYFLDWLSSHFDEKYRRFFNAQTPFIYL